MSVRLIGLAALLAAAWFAGGQMPTKLRPAAETACGDSVRLSWEPASPRQGALFRVRVSGVPPGASLVGRAGPEILHFMPARGISGAIVSLAAVPIDATDSLGIEVQCAAGGRADTLTAHVTPTRGAYSVERLRVAPAFGRPPDSALAARIQLESGRAAEVASASHDTPRLWDEPFVRPRASRITSGYGRGREYNGTITSRHMGTDFAGAPGSPVRAANRGVARIVDAFYYGGNVVYLDHGSGLTTAYLHLSTQRLAVNDTVERGQIIGTVGATGRVTGPHLHFIVRYGTVTVDPLSLYAIVGDSMSRPAASRPK